MMQVFDVEAIVYVEEESGLLESVADAAAAVGARTQLGACNKRICEEPLVDKTKMRCIAEGV
jgi:hypothetical protein